MSEEKPVSNQIKTKLIIKIVLAILVVGALVAASFIFKPKHHEIITVTSSQLEEVVMDSVLSTLEYSYNGVVTMQNEKGKDICHIKYHGVIKYGVDFSRLVISVDDENKTIKISLPPVQISETNISGKLEFLWINPLEKYNLENDPKAWDLCKETIHKNAISDTKMAAYAKENAVSSVKVMVEDFLKQLGCEYELVVK